MPQTLNYIQSGAVTVVISGGDADSLANNGYCVGGDYINASGYPFAEVEYLGPARSWTANTGVSMWFLRGVISGTYEDGSGMVARMPDVVFPFVSGSLRVVRRCQLPPQASRVLIRNDGTGVAFGSSGHIVRVYPLTYQVSSGA